VYRLALLEIVLGWGQARPALRSSGRCPSGRVTEDSRVYRIVLCRARGGWPYDVGCLPPDDGRDRQGEGAAVRVAGPSEETIEAITAARRCDVETLSSKSPKCSMRSSVGRVVGFCRSLQLAGDEAEIGCRLGMGRGRSRRCRDQYVLKCVRRHQTLVRTAQSRGRQRGARWEDQSRRGVPPL
jgi:hypothetical protein